MVSTASPTRRVLGQKDANASLNVLSPRNNVKSLADPSDLLSPLGKINVTQTKSQTPPVSPRVARKRRISEVDDVETNEDKQNISTSQQTEILDDVSSGNKIETQSSEASDMPTGTSTSTLYHERDLGEQQFDLPGDQMSPSTIDKMHEVQMPQQNPDPEIPQPNVGLNSEDSQLSTGMSSFVDFGGGDSSQRSTKPQSMSPETQSVTIDASLEESEEKKRKVLMTQKADELRTRLQFAYFKVQTNQTTTPLSRLKVPEAMKKASSPSLSGKSIQLTRHMNPPTLPRPGRQHDDATVVSSLEDRISTMRARATGQTKPPIPNLDSLPIPKIVPRASSIDGNHADSVHAHPARKDYLGQRKDIPSSPPMSSNSADVDEEISTNLPRSDSLESVTPNVQPRSWNQLSSPPPSHDGSDGDCQQTPRASSYKIHGSVSNTAKDTPSRAIKGEVADSLLQLMRGVGPSKGTNGA